MELSRAGVVVESMLTRLALLVALACPAAASLCPTGSLGKLIQHELALQSPFQGFIVKAIQAFLIVWHIQEHVRFVNLAAMIRLVLVATYVISSYIKIEHVVAICAHLAKWPFEFRQMTFTELALTGSIPLWLIFLPAQYIMMQMLCFVFGEDGIVASLLLTLSLWRLFLEGFVAVYDDSNDQ